MRASSPAKYPAGDGGPLILAIESATPRGSVALVSDGTVLGEVLLPEGRQASETFLPAVSGLLGDMLGSRLGGDTARSRADALSAETGKDQECPASGCRAPSHVAVSAGPGSFTGLRVGMAAAKGFCLGWGIPLVPVPTLHALALRFPVEGASVCAVLDARKREVYAGVFRREAGECVRIAPDRAVAPEDLPALLPPGRVFFCGDGTVAYGALFRARLGERALFPPDGDEFPRAAAVGLLAARLIREGKAADPRAVVPAYLRPSEAEVKRRR